METLWKRSSDKKERDLVSRSENMFKRLRSCSKQLPLPTEVEFADPLDSGHEKKRKSGVPLVVVALFRAGLDLPGVADLAGGCATTT